MSKNLKITLGAIYLLILISFLYFLFSKFEISRINDFSYYKLIQSNIEEFIGKNLVLNLFLFFLFSSFWVILLGFGSPILLFQEYYLENGLELLSPLFQFRLEHYF